MRRARTDNKWEKDARDLYMSNSLHRAHIKYPVKGVRDDFFPPDVKRNCPFQSKKRRTGYDC